MDQSGEGQARRLGTNGKIRPTRSQTTHIVRMKRKSMQSEDDNGDGVGQVENEDDSVMALGGDQTHVYG
jgi:hypothetical protein